jgi:hypothetical protein
MRHNAWRRFVAACATAIFVSACCFIHPFYKQENRPVVYRYHPSIPGHWIPSIDSAANTWNGTINMFASGGFGGGATYAPDGINSIFMTAFSNPFFLAAVGTPITDFCGIHDTDMGWSVNHPFFTNGATYDVETVALHEFGHYGILGHVMCPSSAVMVPSYQGVRRNTTGCDRFGMFVSNVLPECFPAMGICRPSFLFSALGAFSDLDEEDNITVEPFQEHRDELIQIWEGDSALRSSSDSVGSYYDSMADDYRNGGSAAHSNVFTWSKYWELDSQVISRVYQSASYGLRADIDAARQNLQSKIGLTYGQIFSGDIGQYEPTVYGGGGGIDDGGGGDDDPCDGTGPRGEIQIECPADQNQ